MKRLVPFIAGGVAVVAALFGWDYYAKNFRDKATYQVLGEGLSQSFLRDSLLSVESYRLIFGFYPQTIEQLRGGSFHVDPASDKCGCSTDYFYQLLSDGKTYYLFSKGRDCIPFTTDDLYPQLTDEERRNIGFRIPPPADLKPSKNSC
jgi:hypothetical protein